MRITKRQLRRMIKEELDQAAAKHDPISGDHPEDIEAEEDVWQVGPLTQPVVHAPQVAESRMRRLKIAKIRRSLYKALR